MGGFNTISIVPYVAVPPSVGNTQKTLLARNEILKKSKIIAPYVSARSSLSQLAPSVRIFGLGFGKGQFPNHQRIQAHKTSLSQLYLNNFPFGFFFSNQHISKLDQVNCAKVKYSRYIVYLKNLHPLKKTTLEKYSSLKASRP